MATPENMAEGTQGPGQEGGGPKPTPGISKGAEAAWTARYGGDNPLGSVTNIWDRVRGRGPQQPPEPQQPTGQPEPTPPQPTQPDLTPATGAGGIPPEQPLPTVQGPEGPRGPEPPREETEGTEEPEEEPLPPFSEEDIFTAEFRRWGMILADRISRDDSPENYQAFYVDGGTRAQELYDDFRRWVYLNGRRSVIRPPRKEIRTDEDRIERPAISEQVLPGLPIDKLYADYKNLLRDPNPSPDKLEKRCKFEEDLSKYFLEAKRLGLLQAADESLNKFYQEIMENKYGMRRDRDGNPVQRLSPVEIRAQKKDEIEMMEVLGEEILAGKFRSLRETDVAKANAMAGVWKVYAELAIQRFAMFLNGEIFADRGFIPGEFDFDTERTQNEFIQRQGGEVFWRPTYANYYEIYARTPAEFRRAAETFVQWVREAISRNPQEVSGKLHGFKEQLTASALRAGVDSVEIRRQLEAQLGIYIADWANEHYNPDFYQRSLDIVVEDEGTARFVSLSKLSRGKLAAGLWKLDYDPAYEIFFSPQGSRGQFGAREEGVVEERLQDHMIDRLIIELMGVEIKDYDPREPDAGSYSDYAEANLDELVRFQSDEEFQNLFEGFTVEEQRAVYADLESHLRDMQNSEIIVGQLKTKLKANREKNIADPKVRNEYEELTAQLKWYEAYIQAEESKLTDYQKRQLVVGSIREALEVGLDPDELESKLGKKAAEIYREAESAAHSVLELYGVMGDKAKRGGGIFQVYRQEGGRQWVDYVPIHKAEKFVQFAESWTKAEYGHLPASFVNIKVAQARKMAIWAFARDGYDARLFDFTLLGAGQRVDLNAVFDQRGYHPLSRPTILSYSQDGQPINLALDKDNNPIGIQVDSQGRPAFYYQIIDPETHLGIDFFHQPRHPNMLGYDHNGNPVTLSFDKDSRPVGIPWDEHGRAEIYAEPQKKQPYYGSNGKLIKSDNIENKRIYFENLNRNTVAEKMLLKTPRMEQDPDTDKKHVDFQTANDTRHPYARWSSHIYWGYQEQDTELILRDSTFEVARQIRDGLIRPEDAKNPHALQLLIIDPTLERVANIEHKRNVANDIVLAAVSDSYDSHWRITDQLHEVFLPYGPDGPLARVSYGLQDWGGSTKEWYAARAEAARWPNMKVRRFRTRIAHLPIHYSSWAEMWGAGGALEVLRMMAYGTQRMGEYKMVGQFALEKIVKQIKGAQALYDALFGFYSEQEGRSREGFGEKPTIDGDAIERLFDDLDVNLDVQEGRMRNEAKDNEYVNEVRKRLERFEITLQRIRVLETDMRGDRAPLDLRGIEIWERNDDGSIKIVNGQRVFNSKIEELRDSGSSRHSGDTWFWRVVSWLVSPKAGEGGEIYPYELKYFLKMNLNKFVAHNLGKIQTRWAWLLGKGNR